MNLQNVIYVEDVKDALVVPSLAVKGDTEGQYVEILTSKGVRRRAIETGISDGMIVEVKTGVNEDDEVIIAKMSSSEISDMALNSRRGRRRF